MENTDSMADEVVTRKRLRESRDDSLGESHKEENTSTKSCVEGFSWYAKLVKKKKEEDSLFFDSLNFKFNFPFSNKVDILDVGHRIQTTSCQNNSQSVELLSFLSYTNSIQWNENFFAIHLSLVS